MIYYYLTLDKLNQFVDTNTTFELYGNVLNKFDTQRRYTRPDFWATMWNNNHVCICNLFFRM